MVCDGSRQPVTVCQFATFWPVIKRCPPHLQKCLWLHYFRMRDIIIAFLPILILVLFGGCHDLSLLLATCYRSGVLDMYIFYLSYSLYCILRLFSTSGLKIAANHYVNCHISYTKCFMKKCAVSFCNHGAKNNVNKQYWYKYWHFFWLCRVKMTTI